MKRSWVFRLVLAGVATAALLFVGIASWTRWGAETGSSGSVSQPHGDNPPPLVANDEDVGAVVRSFVVYQQWLLEHPDAADVHVLYSSNSVKGSQLASAIEGLAERGERFDCGSPPRVTIIDEPAKIAGSPKTVRVLAHVRRGSCQLLDSSNRELSEQPGYVRRAFSYTLQHNGDRWYVIEDDDLGDA